MGAILPWKSIRTTYSQISGEDRDIAQKPNNQRDTDRQSSLSASHELDSEESLDNSRFPDINEESLTGTALSLWDTGKLSLEFCILWVSKQAYTARLVD